MRKSERWLWWWRGEWRGEGGMDQYAAGGLPALASGVIDAEMLILSVVLCFVLCCVYVFHCNVFLCCFAR